MSDNHQPDPDLDLVACLEALLFVASGAVTTSQLASALEVSPREVEAGLQELESRYQQAKPGSGLRLERHHGRYQITTFPGAAHYIERFLGLDATSHLSRAALETLAIIAYQEPVTRPFIESIRGVNSDGVIKSLLGKGLIQEVGRAESPGRPILYMTTSDFLQHFGLSSLAELPPLPANPSASDSQS